MSDEDNPETVRGAHDVELDLREERLVTRTETQEIGRVRATKRIETMPYEQTVTRGVEHADIERSDAVEGDSGQVETLPDGSVSIPIFEEQVVITKHLVVRERVIVRKQTVAEEQVVTEQLRKERIDIETSDGVVVHGETS